jgi:ubiquitin C-terminal hydrolase
MAESNNESQQGEKGIVGLQNMGNTCYANATLQILRAVPEWSVFCMSNDFAKMPDEKKSSKQGQIILAYQDILKSLWSAHYPAYVRPLGFLFAIQNAVKGSVYDSFGRREQNDSHEYLIYLLDNFHEALREKPDANEIIRDGWLTYRAANTSPVMDLFFSMTRKTVTCTGCNNKTYSYESYNIFKIPTTGDSFEEWISNELTQTEIEDYDCIKCRPTRRKAVIENHLWHLPSSLFIAIRRFQPDGRKDMKPCPYKGEKINLGKFFAKESPDASREYTYEIRGIVDHHGNHMGGHYTAQFCNPITKNFWWMDDERSQKMESPLFGPSTYLLYFRKVDA